MLKKPWERTDPWWGLDQMDPAPGEDRNSRGPCLARAEPFQHGVRHEAWHRGLEQGCDSPPAPSPSRVAGRQCAGKGSTRDVSGDAA